MTIHTIRKKLHSLIDNADDKTVEEMYSLLENEIKEKNFFKLTESHLSILNDEREKHLADKTRSYSWEEAKQIIRRKKS